MGAARKGGIGQHPNRVSGVVLTGRADGLAVGNHDVFGNNFICEVTCGRVAARSGRCRIEFSPIRAVSR